MIEYVYFEALQTGLIGFNHIYWVWNGQFFLFQV